MRAFIAIEFPEEIKTDIFHNFEKLKETGIVSGNFVEKENLHLTLKFLGDLNEEKAKKIQEKLSEVNFRKFRVKIGEIGFFPKEKYIRTIWIELKAEEIQKLQKIIDDKLFEIGISKDEREFTSHITAVRIKSVKNKDIFLERLKKLRIKKQDFEVSNFSLIKSELTARCPIYKKIADFKLN